MRRVIERSVHVHGRLEAGKIPIHEGPALAAGMFADARRVLKSAEYVHFALIQIKLGPVEAAAAFQRVLIDEEDLVDGPQRVDLEFIVAVVAAEENFNVVVEPDE